MIGSLRSTRARSLVMLFIVAGVCVGSSAALARTRRARNTESQPISGTVVQNHSTSLAPVNDPVPSEVATHAAPAPQSAQEQAEREAAIAEVRRAVGESPVDRVKDFENPFDPIVSKAGDAQPLPPAQEEETSEKWRLEGPVAIQSSGTNHASEEPNEQHVGADAAHIFGAENYSSVDHMLHSKNADWLRPKRPKLPYISWGGGPPYRLPTNAGEMVTAYDDGFQDALERLSDLTGFETWKTRLEMPPTDSLTIFGPTEGFWGEKLAADFDLSATATTLNSLPSELRGLARRLDVRAADLEDARQFADADRVRELAELLRREARGQAAEKYHEPELSKQEIYELFGGPVPGR